MSTAAEWQEIDRLKAQVRRIESALAKQAAKTQSAPHLRLGYVVAASTDDDGNKIYQVKERTVDTVSTDQFEDVYPVPSDTGPQAGQSCVFCMDDAGKRYILPSGSRLIAIRDMGGNNGKHVEISKTGAVSYPDGAETLPLVFAEPLSFFYTSRPSKTGRIYPGLKLQDTDGNKYYLAFLEGHGDQVKTFQAATSIVSKPSVTFSVYTDGQGNVTGVNLS